MDFITVTNQMISLVFIMAIGYVMYKARVIDDAAKVRYTRMVLNISLPAQIITIFIESSGVVSNREVLEVFAISLCCYALYALLGFLFCAFTKVSRKERGTYLFMMIFGNVGFMGFPVITTIFGDRGMIYAIIYNIAFNVLIYSVGIQLISGSKGGFHLNPRLFVNMPMISALVSVALFFAGISLPGPIMTSLGYLGNLTTPVSMLILGATIASMPVRELFDDWRIYVFSAVRLAAVPLAVLAVFRVLRVTTPLVAGVLVVLTAMPVASNATMLSIEYGGDLHLASKGIFFTTVLSVLTIPFIALLCQGV